MAQVRAGIKAERKQYVSVRPSNLTVQNNPATPANATQVWSLTQSVFFVLVENSLLQDCKSPVILVIRIQFTENLLMRRFTDLYYPATLLPDLPGNADHYAWFKDTVGRETC